MIGRLNNPCPTIPCILHLGQSNGDGNAQSERLANTLWNFEGISTSPWGTTRTSEPQYSTSPTGVSIYNKEADSTAQWMLDNGAWEAYVMGTNSRNAYTGAGQFTYFGAESIVAERIIGRIGGEVCIMKPSFRATSINSVVASVEPGAWNNNSRTIAMQAFIERGVRDFAAYRPGYRMKLVGIQWWQGEGEATAGMSAADYTAAFTLVYDAINACCAANFVMTHRTPIWNLVGLNFINLATPALVNLALADFASSHERCFYIDQHLEKSLQKQNLTAAQADPLTKGVNPATPNASGGFDDEHSSYLAHQIVGEVGEANIYSTGIYA